MDPDAVRLADALDDLAAFLAAHKEGRWAEWVGQDASRVRRRDPDRLTHFLSAFGGMGSLNDLYIQPLSGDASSQDAVALTEAFDRLLLLEAAWEKADALRHDAGQ